MACELLSAIADPCCRAREEIDRFWAEEAERRINDLDSGKIQAIPGEQIFTDIRERLNK